MHNAGLIIWISRKNKYQVKYNEYPVTYSEYKTTAFCSKYLSRFVSKYKLSETKLRIYSRFLNQGISLKKM